MKSNRFLYIFAIMLFVFYSIPSIAFCDLKPLEDDDLSKIEAQSGFSERVKGLHSDEKSREPFDCIIGEDGFCGVSSASTCSTRADCFNNDPFTANYPNPTQTYYMNQAPSCRSGGCGK